MKIRAIASILALVLFFPLALAAQTTAATVAAQVRANPSQAAQIVATAAGRANRVELVSVLRAAVAADPSQAKEMTLAALRAALASNPSGSEKVGRVYAIAEGAASALPEGTARDAIVSALSEARTQGLISSVVANSASGRALHTVYVAATTTPGSSESGSGGDQSGNNRGSTEAAGAGGTGGTGTGGGGTGGGGMILTGLVSGQTGSGGSGSSSGASTVSPL